MLKGYNHVTQNQKFQIYGFLSIGMSNQKIAQQLNLSPSTIGRKIKRNTGLKVYRYEQSNPYAQERRSVASKK